jgi:hypothetical protein
MMNWADCMLTLAIFGGLSGLADWAVGRAAVIAYPSLFSPKQSMGRQLAMFAYHHV